jgi:hypothetical protein
LQFSQEKFKAFYNLFCLVLLLCLGQEFDRPMSLISCVGKLMEQIVYKHVYNHLVNSSLIYKYQSGFLPKYSTVHQLLELYNSILNSLKNDISFSPISFMYIRNMRRPSTDPWGTPAETGSKLDHSTVHQLLELYNSILNSLKKNQNLAASSFAIFLKLSTRFGTKVMFINYLFH